MAWIKFQILDDPKQAELHFSKGLTTRDIKPYRLVNGKVYNLPQHIIDHLNTREVPIYENKKDEEGQIKSVFVRTLSRFSCIPAPGPKTEAGKTETKKETAKSK